MRVAYTIRGTGMFFNYEYRITAAWFTISFQNVCAATSFYQRLQAVSIFIPF